MSDLTFTAGASGSFQRQMWRRTSRGDMVLLDVDQSEYCTPPRGARGRFELSGFSPTYERQETWEGKVKTVTRTHAEYRVVKLPGNADLEGMRFSQQFPIPKNISDERSKLGQFLRALLDHDFETAEEVNAVHFIGTTFVTSTTLDINGDKSYPGISWATIDPSKTALSPYVNQNGAQPALAPAGGVEEEEIEDPFESDGEDL